MKLSGSPEIEPANTTQSSALPADHHWGTKIPVGLPHGDTENATVVKALLADLLERGSGYSGGLLVIIDGPKLWQQRSARCSLVSP